MKRPIHRKLPLLILSVGFSAFFLLAVFLPPRSCACLPLVEAEALDREEAARQFSFEEASALVGREVFLRLPQYAGRSNDMAPAGATARVTDSKRTLDPDPVESGTTYQVVVRVEFPGGETRTLECDRESFAHYFSENPMPPESEVPHGR